MTIEHRNHDAGVLGSRAKRERLVSKREHVRVGLLHGFSTLDL